MFCKAILALMLAGSVLSLECYFQVQTELTQIDITGGVDKCESGDNYCVNVVYDGIHAKGCSRTAGKMSIENIPISCESQGCDGNDKDGVLCCCTGNKCNGSAGIGGLMSFISLIIYGFYMTN